MHRKIISQYLTLSTMFVVGHMFTSAMYVTFLREKGLNLLQVNLVNTVFFATIFICEIPTGVFADIFGRKRSFIIACWLTAIGSVVYGMSRNFWGFACAEALVAVGFTFKSGAFKAWFVDSLKHAGHGGDLAKVFGLESWYGYLLGSVGCIIGAYIGSKYPTVPWFIGGAIAAVVAVMAQFMMKEEYFVHEEFSWGKGYRKMKDIAVSSIRYGVNDRAVRFILTITFIQIFSVQAINMFWQPFFASHHVAKQHFGFIFAGMMISLSIGSYIASRTNSLGKERVFILRSHYVIGILIVLSVLFSSLPVVLLFFMLHEVFRGFWQPMKDSYLHHRIQSRERATIASFCSISPHIGGAIGLVASGAIGEYGGITMAWIVAGCVLMFGALLVSRNGFKHAD